MEKTSSRLSPSVAISSLNRDVFVRALRQLNRTNPEAAELIGSKCAEHAGVTRFRAGSLYSSGGLAFDAAGALTSGNVMSLYTIPLGQADPVLGPLQLDDTNLKVGGKVQGSASFIAVARGWEVFFHRSSAVLPDAAQVGGLAQLARATGFTTSVVGNDIQRNGVVSAFPAPTMYPAGVLGNLLAGAQASAGALVGAGWDEIVPVDPLLEIGPDSTLEVVATFSGGQFGNFVPGDVIKVAFRHWFFGYELNQVRG